MLKFLHAESKTVVSAAFVVGVLSFASRLVGLVRDRILAGEFGAGNVLDVYYAAFKMPDFLFSLIVVGSVSASFIPLFAKYYHGKAKRENAWKFANNTLHLVVCAMTVLTIVLIIFAGPIAGIIAPGFEVAKQAEVAKFMRIMFLAQIILAGSMVYGSVLQGMKRFALYSLAPVLYNVGIIVGAVWFVDVLGPIGLAWGVVFGALLHFVVQFIGVLSTGYRYKWSFDVRDKDTVEVIRLAGPRMLGIAISQINVVVFAMIASTLAVGSVTVFQYAYNIQFFAVGIIGVSYAIAAFPSFAEHLAKDDKEGFLRIFSNSTRQILFFLMPLSALFLILRAQIVRVIVGAGAFDWAATILTADTLAFFTFSFITQSLVYLCARAFFAVHDTLTPLVAGLTAALIGVVSALWLSQMFGVVGLGMAFSISSIVNLALLWVPLRQRMGSLDEQRILRTLYSVLASGVVAALVMQYLKGFLANYLPLETFLGIFAQGLIAGGLGLVVYVIATYFLKVEELHDVLTGVRRKFFRKFEPAEPISNESSTAA